MRDVLDCGVLLAHGHERAMDDWVAAQQARLTRVRLHPVPLAPRPRQGGAEVAPPSPDALARLALALRRYDGCILPVAPFSLAWARMALQQAGDVLATPILLLIHDMKAPAILDLLNLGAADFIAQPACAESMRVRLGRLGRQAPWRDADHAAAGVQEFPASYLGAEAAGGAGSGWEKAAAASRPRVATKVMEHALVSMRHQPEHPLQHRHAAQESFRLAKARVVDGFEREYIRHALSRHGGNVAQAARACSKHRRAFWALMRKHSIEAAPYRRAAHGRDL
ncbi:helix-turn-helix domain-containing protein [Achromobacter sp. NPDC058515]|uniref:helix-turn-helix domain-containing protein n=1 Tax=Achromobacter sp. NPDC058515 TaxID=3346533 RepID=UPI0036514D5E